MNTNLSITSQSSPLTVIIFGATGDLAKKKLIPALFDLYTKKMLPDNFRIVGFSRKDIPHKDYRDFVIGILDKKENEEMKKTFAECISYTKGDISDLDTYRDLALYLGEVDAEMGICSNKLFYLAVPPTLYETSFTFLSESGMATPCVVSDDDENHWTRVLVEKPFGSDQETAQRLDLLLGKLFSEEQIFRIDHYLAKESVQNIISFRFANSFFEPVWNKDYIERVDIKLYEKNDVSERGAFYDSIGALRDVGQNHILQMLALVAMEDPKELAPKEIREARYEVLKNTKPFHSELESCFTRGQYNDYEKGLGVNPESKTETYFKIKMAVDTDRFRAVPFYLESGKALKESKTEIIITFKEPLSCVCPSNHNHSHKNKLIFRIQPDESITLCFFAKKPGFEYDLEEKDFAFSYDSSILLPDAYERVLFDAIRGDQTLFTSTKEVQAQWGIISPIRKEFDKLPLIKYKKGIDPEKLQDNT